MIDAESSLYSVKIPATTEGEIAQDLIETAEESEAAPESSADAEAPEDNPVSQEAEPESGNSETF